MQRHIKPEWLLRQANELAGRSAGAGQPRNTNLRRAVSAAYYALFHHLVLDAVSALLPDGRDEQHWRLARHFDHRALKQVCEWIIGPKQPPSRVREAVDEIRAVPEFVDIGLAFSTLQEARHDADYDHLAEFAKAEVLSLIDSARDAIDKLNIVSGSPEHRAFVVHLALRTPIRQGS